MKKFFAVCRNALFLYLVDPLFYLCTAAVVLFCSFRFFFIGGFFLSGQGSTDLRPLYSSIPALSILIIPLLVLRLRTLLGDKSIPVTPLIKHAALSLSTAAAFFVSVALLFIVPVSVSHFGVVSSGQLCTSFLGILMYSAAASSFAVFIFSCFSSSSVPFFLTAVLLALFNTVHMLPLTVPVGANASSFIHALSFAYHFDAAEKGIFDTRDFMFYVITIIVSSAASAFVSNKQTGKKNNILTVFLSLCLFVLLGSVSSRIYVRKDFTESKQFSVSELSRTVCSQIPDVLKITYFQSQELKSMYPQTNDISEFLYEYGKLSKKIAVSIKKADAQQLSSLGIQGQQIRTASDTKTELTTVYSCILIEYLGKQEQIPFILSTQTLEYDLTHRIQQLVFGIVRPVVLMTGNGLSAEQDYQYVQPWLESRGFSVSVQTPDSFFSSVSNVTVSQTELVLLGSSELTKSQSSSLDSLYKSGMNMFIASSPYKTTITGDWTVTASPHDTLLPVLNAWGVSFNKSLAADISCFPMTLESGEGSTAEQTTVNYPLWVSILPQTHAPQGITLFWASPLVLYGKSYPLLVTTKAAWNIPETDTGAEPFMTNPFLIAKTASAAQAAPSIQILAARIPPQTLSESNKTGSVSVVSDQYFVSSLMSAFTAGSTQGDFRNYDFLASQLLSLRGEDSLCALMNKSLPNTQLTKITDESAFAAARKKTIIVVFYLLPLFIVFCFFFVILMRHVNNRNCKERAA
jgi:ABC-type uncharacterized transport system involved in gliding motility auxiliary subunit